MNAKCIKYPGHNYHLTVGNVYEVLGRRRKNGETFFRVYRDHSEVWHEFPKTWFELTLEPVTLQFPFRVKCKFDFTWVFSYSGGSYQRSLSEYITVGNVYEVIAVNRNGYYIMLPDHGTCTEELPDENFECTLGPVTPNPLREKEEADRVARQRQSIEDRETSQREQSITDAMDQYYNPKAYYAGQEAKETRVRALQQVFVCGLPYSN